MRTIRYLAGVVVAVIIEFTSFASIAEQKVIILGDDGYAPFSFIKNNQPQGIYVNILNEVFKKLEGYDVSFQMLPWKRSLNEIKRGTGFAVFPPYHFPKERPYMTPYSEPILLEQVIAICHNKVLKNERKKWPEDYYGLKIGTNDGFLSPGPDFFSAAEQGRLSLIEATNTRSGLRMLLARRTDCYVNAEMSIRWGLLRLRQAGLYDPGLDQLRFGAVIDAEWGYIGYTNTDNGAFPFKDDFIKKVNKIIRAMKADGSINQIIEDFFEY
ncbi:substrate-binding periplasmic protein [Kiloniella majae]|uniref:substrate-binding periplasmic protein n=1 Tax=Kiloniella majae TaxID=1938558 RepID=UPI000A278310|nr:transporter substrate-binding domain-containing protein [Kiloniella majae]